MINGDKIPIKIPIVAEEDMSPAGEWPNPLYEAPTGEQSTGILGKLGITKPKKLGDCKCIPKRDKEDLNYAILVSELTLAEKAMLAGIDTERGHLAIKRSIDINDLKVRINNTPTCENGDILKECTCLSNSDRESLNLAISLANRKFSKRPNLETIHRLNLMKDKIENIPNRCKKFLLF